MERVAPEGEQQVSRCLFFIKLRLKTDSLLRLSAFHLHYDGIMKSLEESLRSEQCRRILSALADGSKTSEELVLLTKLTSGSIEKHVSVLVAGELVKVSKAGKISLRSN
jgi:hypothetical protein